MNEILSLIVCGSSIAGSIGAVIFFKNKYDSLTKELLAKQNKIDKTKDLQNNQQKITQLEKELLEEKTISNNLETQYKEAVEQNSFYQNQIVSLKEEISISNKNEAEELNNAFHKIQLLQNRENELSLLLKNNEIKRHETEHKLIAAEALIDQVKQEISTLSEKANPPAKEIKQKSILMVDDSAVIRVKMKKLLVEAGYDLTLANDGLEALNVLPTKHFDLIITDLEMPNLDGFGLLVKLNENPETKHIPVIVITGHEDLHINVSTSENLSGIYKKPWKEPELLQKIKFLSSIER